MALGRDVVDAIIREHAYRPITGHVLLIGQQAITLSRDEVLELMREHRPRGQYRGNRTLGEGTRRRHIPCVRPFPTIP